MGLLNATEIAKIETAIAAAEAHSAGELVVALVQRSSGYASVRGWMTLLWTVSLTLACHEIWPALGTGWLLTGQYLAAVALWWLLGRGPILRWLARRQVPEAVRKKAFQVFAERGIHQTRDRSGLLIMISELEHRVVILGDTGIHAHLGLKGWEGYVQRIVDAIHQGRLAAVLQSEIEALGALLATKFPPRADDVNELPNEVVRS